MAHQAVESFVNLLAEVRAYGQGVMIVEQLPSKLASDVAKHAGLALVHRLTPREDRELVGDAMVLSEEQKRALAVLRTGQAVVFAHGMDGAIRIQVDPGLGEAGGPRRLATQGVAAPLERRLARATVRLHLCGLLGRREVEQAADAHVLIAALGGPSTEPLHVLQQVVARHSGREPAISLALEDALTRRALAYGWRQAELDRLVSRAPGEQGQFVVELRRVLVARRGEHSFCAGCTAACTVGFEGSRLARNPMLADAVDDLDQHSVEEWRALIGPLVGVAVEHGFGLEMKSPEVLLRCAVGHALLRLGLTRRATVHVLEHITSPQGGSS